jgi:hypothetical protein
MAKTRALRKAGKLPVQIVVEECQVEQLVDNGILDPMLTDDKSAIATAIERAVAIALRATTSPRGLR